MKKTLTLLTIGTLLLSTGCFSTKAEPMPAPATEPANTPTAAAPSAQPQSESDPTLQMEVKVSGNQATIHFHTENFKLAPEHYSQAHVPGEGHIHLFVDGTPDRIGVKENTYTLTDLKPGKHNLRASLHTNNHQPYHHAVDTLEFEIK